MFNAFLQGDLYEEAYMKLPQGFRIQEDHRACKLMKSLYGLKQASRQWNIKLTEAIINAGCKQSLYDYSLFTKQKGQRFATILVYVGNLLITGNSEDLRQKNQRSNALEVQD